MAAGGVAFRNYYNAAMDSIHEGFLRVQDFDEQKRLADRTQLLFFEDPPSGLLGHLLHAQWLQGLREERSSEHPGQPEYNNVWLSR